MIGGVDIVLPISDPSIEVLDMAIRQVIRKWPFTAIVEDVSTGALYTRYRDIKFRDLNEVMIYKNEHYFEQWEKLGAGEGHENTMVHLIKRDTDLTIVVDDKLDPEMVSLIEAIRRGLKMHIFSVSVERMAA